jgi:uncharacterized membrane protein YjdF
MRTETMVDVATESTGKRSFKQVEFFVFSLIIFAAKSYLLVRLPYREWHVNALYTSLILIAFYCYFRFRYGITPPAFIVFCLAAAVAIDVLGNYLHLYGHPIGPVQFDEFAHFTTSAFSLVPSLWLLRATTSRFGLKLPLNLAAFFSVAITFSFCAYYEILELWDERYFGDFQRLWTPQDSANDLQWDLFGIVVAALVSAAFIKLADKYSANRQPA